MMYSRGNMFLSISLSEDIHPVRYIVNSRDTPLRITEWYTRPRTIHYMPGAKF